MSELYPEKSLRYKLLEFILKIRRKTRGIGGRIRIPLKDIEYLLDYVNIENPEENTKFNKIEILADELIELDEETFGNTETEERPVIKIINREILSNLPQYFNTNGVLVVKCTSENLEEYINLLKKRTENAEKIRGLSKIEDLPNGNLTIVLGDKKVKFIHARAGSPDISINLIRLMYGKNVKGTMLRDYEKGNHVHANEIFNNLNYILDSEITSKQISDSIRGINNKIYQEFGSDLLDADDQGLRLIL